MEEAYQLGGETLEGVSRDSDDLDELAARVASGDRAAFDDLYTRTVDEVYAFVRGQCRNDAEAEDIIANVFLKVWRSARSYRVGSGQFRRWLFAIARNEVKRAWAQRKREAAPLPEEIAEAEANRPGLDIPTRDLLHRAMLVLTPEQRDVVVLRYYGGKSHQEIAAILGKREGAVRALLLRALRKMRKAIDDAAGAR
ncbi:ECF RNA polymerase sigma factor SigK [bacterium HR29]|nr:ECF RNA polymerase sigma factor SigK [bacterium HR29]